MAEDLGFDSLWVAEACQQEAAAAIPTELIDTTCICGTPERVRDCLCAYHEAGVDTLILGPAAVDGDALSAQLQPIAQAGAEFLNVDHNPI